MSGFEPVIAEAAAAELGTTALAAEVMAPEVIAATTGAGAGAGAGLSGISGLFGTGLEGAAANGGLGALAQSTVPTMAEQLVTANPEALGQLQNAVMPSMSPDQLAQLQNATQPLSEAQYNFLHNSTAGYSPGTMTDAGGASELLQAPVADVASANLTQSPFLQQAQTAMQAAQANPELAQAAIDQGLSTPTELSSDLTQKALQNAASQYPPAQYPPEPGNPLGGLGDMASKAFKGFMEMPTKDKLLYGGVASLATPTVMGMLKKKKELGGAAPYDGPLSKFRYDPAQYTSQNINPPTPYRPRYAQGGLPDLGGYSDYAGGGRMLKGPGDGMSDNIPATIAGKQPARLANEEFVIPADVVSHLGNGSSEAGAKQLYKMMDRVRQARTGKKAQGKQIKADKYMPV